MNKNNNIIAQTKNECARPPVQIKYLGASRPHDTVGQAQASRVFLAALAGQVVAIDKPAIRAHYEAQLAELRGETVGRAC